MSRIHELKTIQPFFDQIKHGTKKFELRKNDRDFRINDILILKEYIPNTDLLTGEILAVKVIGILDQFIGIQQGYCIMSISLPL